MSQSGSRPKTGTRNGPPAADTATLGTARAWPKIGGCSCRGALHRREHGPGGFLRRRAIPTTKESLQAMSTETIDGVSVATKASAYFDGKYYICHYA